MTYLDPTSCKLKTSVEEKENGEMAETSCGYNQVIGMVAHVDCPSLTENRVIETTGWVDNHLPNNIGYSCINAAGKRTAPSQIFVYCCDIKGLKLVAAKATAMEHTTKLNKYGAITIT